MARTLARRFAREPLFEMLPISQPKEVLPALDKEKVEAWVTDSVGLPIVGEVKRKYPALPVVVYSGTPPPDALPAGVAQWIHKLRDSAELRAVIVNLLEGKK